MLAIQAQCREQGVPFFFKQWGGVRKSNTGRVLSGRTFDEFPPLIRASSPSKSQQAELLETVSPFVLRWSTRSRIRAPVPSADRCQQGVGG